MKGSTIVAGKASDSELFRRIVLPKGHDDIMPPKGEPLSSEQAELFKKWIDQGAEWPEGEIVGTGAHDAGQPAKLPEYKPSAAENKAVAALEAQGVSIRPVAQNLQWKEATFRSLGTNATDATIAPLKDVIGLLDLNLAGTQVTDSGPSAINGLTNLTALHLENTKITDEGLAHVAGLTNLVYLNLFNTPVSDAGLRHLKGLHGLKNLYVWQTKVTELGISNLKQTLPQCKIHTGWELSAAAKPEEKKPEKK